VTLFHLQTPDNWKDPESKDSVGQNVERCDAVVHLAMCVATSRTQYPRLWLLALKGDQKQRSNGVDSDHEREHVAVNSLRSCLVWNDASKKDKEG
jgi:hypothetical protein